MKLSLKMFFGICIPAVISCLVIAAFLIEKNLDENIDAEIQIEKSKVESLRKNKKDTVEERAEKLAALADYEEQLNSISSELNALGQAIE